MAILDITAKAFQPAPLDRLYTLPAIYEWNANNNASRPMARWYNNHEGRIEERTWGEGIQIFRRIASQILAKLGPGAGEAVGILATTGTSLHSILQLASFGLSICIGQMPYWDLFGALVICGYVPFMISSRNSAEAVEFLLDATKSKHLVVSNDKLDASRITCEKLSVGLSLMSDFPADHGDASVKLPSYEHLTLDSPAMISHSSGGTSFVYSETVITLL